MESCIGEEKKREYFKVAVLVDTSGNVGDEYINAANEALNILRTEMTVRSRADCTDDDISFEVTETDASPRLFADAVRLSADVCPEIRIRKRRDAVTSLTVPVERMRISPSIDARHTLIAYIVSEDSLNGERLADAERFFASSTHSADTRRVAILLSRDESAETSSLSSLVGDGGAVMRISEAGGLVHAIFALMWIFDAMDDFSGAAATIYRRRYQIFYDPDMLGLCIPKNETESVEIDAPSVPALDDDDDMWAP